MLFADFKTELLVLSFISSMALGDIFKKSKIFKKINIGTYKISSQGFRILKVLLFIGALLSILIVVRSWVYLLIYDIKLSRDQLYSPIIGSEYFSSILFTALIYLKGICAAVLSFVFFKSIIDGDKKYTIICTVIFLVDSIVFSAKGPIIYLAFNLLLFFILNNKESIIKLRLFIFIFIFILTLSGVYLIDLARGNNIIDSIQRYFSIGPVLLSHIVSGDSGLTGLGNQKNLFIIFSGLDYLIIVIIRGLTGSLIYSNGYDWVKYIDIPQVIMMSSNKFVPFNTFYTVLSEPFLALGWFGVVSLGFGLGWLIANLESRYLSEGCDLALFWLQYIATIAFFGVFVSAFSTVTFWLIILLMGFFSSRIFLKKI